jgi:hypothetical protein
VRHSANENTVDTSAVREGKPWAVQFRTTPDDSARIFVADYDAWRKVHDSVAGMQNDAGVTQQSVHRMADDPDNVLPPAVLIECTGG